MRYRGQPQGNARAHPYWLNRGLVFLFNGATNQDLVTGQLASNSGGVGRRVNINGNLAADISGTQYLSFPDNNRLDITGPLTIFWRGVFDGVDTSYRNLVGKSPSSGGQNTPFDVYINYNTSQFTCVRAGSDPGNYRASYLGTTAPSASVRQTVAFMYASGATDAAPSNGFVNGVTQSFGGSGSAYGVVTSNASGLRIGRREDGNTQLDGGVECIALFNQALTTAEYLRLYQDPWGELVDPQPQWLYTGMGSGSWTPLEVSP